MDWAAFLQRLGTLAQFHVDGELPAEPGWFDAAQVEQALLNLVKNAHESGSDPGTIALRVGVAAGEQRIEVLDRGPGMSEAVLAQALLPFYSTKRSEPGLQGEAKGGTGLGLALVREIAEAHDGRITLGNREGGGLRVVVSLPRSTAPPAR